MTLPYKVNLKLLFNRQLNKVAWTGIALILAAVITVEQLLK